MNAEPVVPASAEPPAAAGGRGWLLALILVVAVLGAYHNSLSGPFLFDDEHAIVENPHLRSLWPPWAPLVTPDNTPLTGRPLVSLTLAVNHALGGLAPWGYHAVNLALHLAAVLLLFGLVRRTLRLPALGDRFSPRVAELLALVVALLWALHPLLTEAVVYVVQRTELLFSLWLLLVLYAVVRGLECQAREGGGSSRGWYMVAVIACFLGMASKEVMVGAPLLVLCYDRLFAAGSFRAALRRRWWLYAGLAASWLLLAGLVVAGSRSHSVSLGYEELSPIAYLRTQAGVIVHYLRLAFWPSPLVIDYDDWPVAAGWGAVAPQAALLAALLGLCLWGLVKGRRWAFPGIAFFVILAPTSSLLPIATEVAAERRMYLPLAALVVALVLGGHALLRRLPRPASLAGLALAALLAASLGWATVQRNHDYRSQLAILQDAVAKRPNNARLHTNLGAALLAQHQAGNFNGEAEGTALLNEAIGHLSTSIQLVPNDSAYANLGMALARRGQLELAVKQYQEALQLNPGNPKALLNLGAALLQQGKAAEAVEQLRLALEVQPDSPEAHNNLAAALWQQGQHEEALEHFRAAVAARPDYREAIFNLGVALLQSGKAAEAEPQLAEAVRLAPEEPQGHLRLAQAQAIQDRLDDAAGQLRRAAELAPNDPEVHYNLGKLLVSQGDLAAGLKEYEAALKLRPNWPPLASSLAWTYATHPDAAIRDGARAVALAEHACSLTGDRDVVCLDTLAAAYAEAGRFDDAVRVARRAVNLATEAGRSDLATALRQRLDRYQQKLPVRGGG